MKEGIERNGRGETEKDVKMTERERKRSRKM